MGKKVKRFLNQDVATNKPNIRVDANENIYGIRRIKG
jgi:hypothetical protein